MKFGVSSELIQLLSYAQLLSLILTQAPGDFSPSCRAGINVKHHIFPKEWTLMIDSFDYANLIDDSLTHPSSVWLRRSFESTASSGFIQVGGECTATIRSCIFNSPPQENWVFSQYISYGTSIQVFFNVTYNFAGCFPPGCDPYFTIYRYDTNGVVSESARTLRNNYRPMFGDEASSRIQGTGGITLDFVRPTASKGMYLGVRDGGSCGHITRLIVYFVVSHGRTDTLLSCPDVPLPVQGSQDISTGECTCLRNSSAVGSLERSCSEDGTCNEDQKCGCDPGFEYNATMSTCVICPMNMYKAGVSNSSCLSCPELSESRNAGSAICECIPPNSRGGGDGPEVACKDRRFPTSSAVAITFFVTFIVVGVVFFLVGGILAYFYHDRIKEKIPGRQIKK